MTTAADWISETEQHLGVVNPQLDKLASAVSSTTGTTLTVTYGNGGIDTGALLAIDLEVMYVWLYDPTTKTATVERGFAGSTAALHDNSSIVYINPEYSKYAIFRALNQDLESLASAGLFKMNTVPLTYNATAAAYDLTSVTNIEGIYRIDANFTGLTDDWRRVHRYSFARDQDTTYFASGYALTIGDLLEAGRSVRVQYRSRFTALSTLASTKASTNLPSSAYDIPPLGAAARLASPGEVSRNSTRSQGNSRRSEEVPAGAIRAAGAGMWALRNSRVSEELLDLKRRYPTLQTVAA